MGNVPHPLRAYLLELKDSVREVQERLGGKLDRPQSNFAAGTVWVGPTAEVWGGQLTAKRTSYNSELGKLDDELNTRIATTPATCTEEEAKEWKRRLGNG